MSAKDRSISALNFPLLRSYAAAAAVINPLARVFGASVTGGANYLAEQTGGVAIKVERTEELGAKLEQVIGAYVARYSLGFTLGKDDGDDGRMHKLQVRVGERGREGRKRRLVVSARRGYYVARASMPNSYID